jgi:hypothetical protein
MIMKKYNVGSASLLLFFATGAAIAMETNKYEVYTIQNKLNDPIKVTIAYKNGEKTEFPLNANNGTANLNAQDKIKKIGLQSAGSDKTTWLDAGKLFKEIRKEYDRYFPQRDMRADVLVFQLKPGIQFEVGIQWTDRKTNKVVEAKDPWSNWVPN